MKHGGADQRRIRQRLLERMIAAMRSKQSRELGVIVLGDHDDRTIGVVSDNHGCLSLVASRGLKVRRVCRCWLESSHDPGDACNRALARNVRRRLVQAAMSA